LKFTGQEEAKLLILFNGFIGTQIAEIVVEQKKCRAKFLLTIIFEIITIVKT